MKSIFINWKQLAFNKTNNSCLPPPTKMKFSAIFLFILFIQHTCFSQVAKPVVNPSFSKLKILEDSLVKLSQKIVDGETLDERNNANELFTKTLTTTINTPNSFSYPFDSLKTVSVLKSPDKNFKIFSWSVADTNGTYHFYGKIQMNREKEAPVFGLTDYTNKITDPKDTVTNNEKWYGAVYYKIIPVYAAKPYYILLGLKGNNLKTTKKVIEVLSFRNEKPEFGRGIFEGKGKNTKRIIFEYTHDAVMLLRFEQEKSLIVFDHLSPPDAKFKNQPETYGPDLSYDGFQLKNGKWYFTENLDMRNVPDNHDIEYHDPKKQEEFDKPVEKKQ